MAQNGSYIVLISYIFTCLLFQASVTQCLSILKKNVIKGHNTIIKKNDWIDEFLIRELTTFITIN